MIEGRRSLIVDFTVVHRLKMSKMLKIVDFAPVRAEDYQSTDCFTVYDAVWKKWKGFLIEFLSFILEHSNKHGQIRPYQRNSAALRHFSLEIPQFNSAKSLTMTVAPF